jgi:hypothetical protein
MLTLLLASCGGSSSGSGSSQTTTTTTTTTTPQYIYSDGYVNGNAAILSFPLTSTGTTVTPTVAASPGTADIILAMSTDGNGNLYAMTAQDTNYSAIAVYVYSMSAGTLTLKRSFTNSTLSIASSMTVDHTGIVYISSHFSPIAAFAATASGAATPSALYTPSAPYNVTQDFFLSMGTDTSGNIYGLDYEKAVIYEYPAGFTSLTPMKTFTYNSNLLGGDPNITVDSSGNVYLVGGQGTGAIATFPAGSTSPTTTITSTNLYNYAALSLDSTGRIWVNTGFGTRYFEAFAANANGNATPVASFSSSTNFTGPGNTVGGPSMVIY